MNGIKCIRERCNFSMSELAARIGVTRQTVSLWEQGTRKPSPTHMKAMCEIFGLSEHYFGNIEEDDLKVIDSLKIYRHRTETSEFYTFKPFGDEQPEPYLTLRYLNGWNDARYAETMQECKKLLERIAASFHEDDPDASLQARISKASRVCVHIEKYMTILSLIEKTKSERGTYLKVPMRFEIWAVLDAMMLAFGLYADEELYQKFESEYVHVDKDYIRSLSEQIRAHWNMKVDFFTACKNRSGS